MEKVKITFADGSEIEAEVNGSSYITDKKPEIPVDLTTITITGESETILNNAELIECASIDGRYWFSFKEISADEQLRADVDYLLCLAE